DDEAEVAGAFSGKIQNRVDRQSQHRTLDEFAALGAEHHPRFGMRVEQGAIDQRRQILAALGGQFKTSLDWIWRCRHCRLRWFRKRWAAKKRAGHQALLKNCVDP